MNDVVDPVGRPSRWAAALVSLTLGLGLVACSAAGDDLGAPAPADGTGSINLAGLAPSGTTSARTAQPPVRLDERAEPTPGLVVVDGASQTLTDTAITSFAKRTDEVTVTRDTSDETRAFARLCSGEVDVVDSTRPISVDEYEQCRSSGLDVLRFRVAADGVVVAVGSQTDVGTDCVSIAQTRTAFEAGSGVTRWSQIGPGLADAAFVAGGPATGNVVTDTFVHTVLGTADPTVAALRDDFALVGTEDQTFRFVVGDQEQRVEPSYLVFLGREHAELQDALTRAWAAWAVTDDEVDAAALEQRRGVRDRRAPAARAQDDARVRQALAQRRRVLGRVLTARSAFRPVDEAYLDLVARQRRADQSRGRVGLFSLAYYASHPDLLRPFEIEAGNDERDCVLPDSEAVLDGRYPLSRQLELTVTTRSLQRPEVRQFLADYLDHSQDYARHAGLVALSDADLARQRDWLDGDRLPRFDVVDGQVDEVVEADRATETPLTPPVQVQVPAR